MKNKVKNMILKLKTVLLAASLYLALPMQVYAAEEPMIVAGTRKLLAAGTALLTGLVVGVIIFNGYKVGMKWINASAEERPKYKKELIEVIVAGVVTLTIGGTITWIVGFYQG